MGLLDLLKEQALKNAKLREQAMGLYEKNDSEKTPTVKDDLSSQQSESTIMQPDTISPPPLPTQQNGNSVPNQSIAQQPVKTSNPSENGIYGDYMEHLIEMALADGVLTDKEKQVLFKKAAANGIDLDEFEMILDARLYEKQKTIQVDTPAPHESAPRSDKYGGPVKRCPACNAVYVAGTAICPECGYAFSGTQANRSAEKLYQLLLEFNEKNPTKQSSLLRETFFVSKNKTRATRKMDVIMNFPVPNNREDLIELLTSIQPKADRFAPIDGYDQNRGNEDMGYAYWLLYGNCINKAQIAFANDPDFAPFLAYYNAEKDKSVLNKITKKFFKIK